MREELERRNFQFIQFFPLRLGFELDFALINEKIGIECDGEKWHRNKKRDNFRDYMLKRAGWQIFRFSGTEIKNNVILCVDKIKR
jgi:very-short-patch-repair endonuclease